MSRTSDENALNRQPSTAESAAAHQRIMAGRTADTDLPNPDARVWQFLYLLIAAVAGLFFFSILSAGDSVNSAVSLIFLAVLVLSLKRWAGALLLALMQATLLYTEPRSDQLLTPLDGPVWIAVGTGLILAVSRYRSLQQPGQAPILQTIRGFAADLSAQKPSISLTATTNLRLFLKTMIRSVGLLIGCAVAAQLLMSLVPLYQPGSGFSTIREFRLKPTGYRVIMASLLLFVIYLPTWLVINEVVWRTRSRRQAGIYLRSIFLKWAHRDIRMILGKRFRARRARVRAVRPVHPPDAGTAVSDFG